MIKFNTPIRASAFLLALFLTTFSLMNVSNANLLIGDDTEEKLEDARRRFLGDPLNPDISEFLSLTGRGSDHLGAFEDMRELFQELAVAINAMREAFTLMFEEFAMNKVALIGIKPVVLQTSDEIDDEDFFGFHRGMSFSTLRLKFKRVEGYEILRAALPKAIEKHIALKTKQLKKKYAKAVKKMTAAQKGYVKIDDLYPGMPDEINVPDVINMDLGGLKGFVPDFIEQVDVYKAGLSAARAWQTSFARLHKTYTGFVSEREKIGEAFEELRDVNDENPHLPMGDLDPLETLEDLGDIEEIAGRVDDVEAIIQDLRAQLAEAKKWAPEADGTAEDLDI